MSNFDHDRLPVYRLAREYARTTRQLMRTLPRGRADLLDQLRRATASIALNIAEGAGEYSAKEKARFYRMAKRSATECAGLLDHLVDNELATSAQIERAHGLLDEITAMLVALIRTIQARK